MKRANTAPVPAIQNDHQVVSDDATPKGRYKSALLSPLQGLPSSSTLAPGFLHSFGFAKTTASSDAESSESSVKSTQQTSSVLDGSGNCQSNDSSSSLPIQENNLKEDKHIDLSESQLNFLSHNLSEIADRISPSKYDTMIETDFEPSEALMDDNKGQPLQAAFPNAEQSRLKTPYARPRRGSKNYVSKQKSFTRRGSQGHHLYNFHQEVTNNEDISVDTTNILTLCNQEALKHDCESDSGYSSSMSASLSLSEEIEASKRLSLENGSVTDVDTDNLSTGGDDITRENSADKAMNESSTRPLLHHNSSNLEERLDSLIHGVSSEIDKLDLNGELTAGKELPSLEMVSNTLDESLTSFKLSFPDDQGKDQPKEKSKELSDNLAKPPFPVKNKKMSSDDTALPRTKSGRRPGVLRRRTTLVSFRPPKQMTVQEGESDIVEMDEVGFLQMLTDVKSLKTQLLKLKRELQEADVVSPLMHSHSSVVRRASISVDADPSMDRASTVYRKRMLLRRTVTMDAAAMHEKLHRTRSGTPSSSVNEGSENLGDITEGSESSNKAKVASSVVAATKQGSTEELKKLREELGEVKNQLVDVTQERNSLLIAREELEHELDSKNHTIRMLQKQLEAQDNRDEIAYFKRQVKSLTDQIQQQQQKITELRYRSTSPGPVHLGAVPNFQSKKETVKADIRNRLRDAFVRHLGESSKSGKTYCAAFCAFLALLASSGNNAGSGCNGRCNGGKNGGLMLNESHVQLSKYIQKAEQNIAMAQKGLSSLYSSPVLSPHASTEHLPKDKSGSSFERSESQSSVERSQEDSDGREYESDSSESRRRGRSSSHTGKNNEDSGSESRKSGRRSVTRLGTSLSQEESDGRTSDSDSGRPSRWRRASPSLEGDTGKLNCTVSELNSGTKIGVQKNTTDSTERSKQGATPSIQRTRKLSRSKLFSKIESSPLSHSWTPGAIEKIVKSWREAKSPESQDKTKEDDSNLKPVSHVQFL